MDNSFDVCPDCGHIHKDSTHGTITVDPAQPALIQLSKLVHKMADRATLTYSKDPKYWIAIPLDYFEALVDAISI